MPSPGCSLYWQSPRVLLQCRVQLRTLRLGRSFHSSAPANADKQPVSLYWAAPPPTPRQLAAARWFFETYSPRRLWTADQWRAQNQVTDEALIIPEVAFLGRSNVGKSSTLNALLNRPGLNPVGPKPGKTSVMTAWALAPLSRTGGALPGFKGDTSTRLTVLDVPGYGYKSHVTWGNEVTKYLSRRKHLKKIFVLVDASHGLVAKDWDMFKLLRQHDIPHQVVATKCDGLLERDGARIAEYEDVLVKIARASKIQDAGELLAIGSRRKKDHDLALDGIDNLRWSVLKSTALDGFVYEMYSKLKESKDFSEEQPPFNSPNPFEQPTRADNPWVGGASRPVMGGLPFSHKPARPSNATPVSLRDRKGQLPPSHPRATQPPKTSPGNSLGEALRNSKSASPSLDEIFSSFRSREAGKAAKTLSAGSGSGSGSGSSSRAPPPSPPADPRSRDTTRLAPTLTPLSPSTPSQSSVPRGIDALTLLEQASSPRPRNPPAKTEPSRRRSGRSHRSRSTHPPPASSSLSSSSSSSSSSNPTSLRPGVSRGLDALLAATGSPKSTSNKGKKASSSPPITPLMTGPGVSRGIDAFMALTQPTPPASTQKSNSSRRRRSKHRG